MFVLTSQDPAAMAAHTVHVYMLDRSSSISITETWFYLAFIHIYQSLLMKQLNKNVTLYPGPYLRVG